MGEATPCGCHSKDSRADSTREFASDVFLTLHGLPPNQSTSTWQVIDLSVPPLSPPPPVISHTARQCSAWPCLQSINLQLHSVAPNSPSSCRIGWTHLVRYAKRQALSPAWYAWQYSPPRPRVGSRSMYNQELRSEPRECLRGRLGIPLPSLTLRF